MYINPKLSFFFHPLTVDISPNPHITIILADRFTITLQPVIPDITEVYLLTNIGNFGGSVFRIGGATKYISSEIIVRSILDNNQPVIISFYIICYID